MINSMQYIFVAGNSNNLYKKIASDLSFLYIEWQYQELREKLKRFETFEEKKAFFLSLKNKNRQTSFYALCVMRYYNLQSPVKYL